MSSGRFGVPNDVVVGDSEMRADVPARPKVNLRHAQKTLGGPGSEDGLSSSLLGRPPCRPDSGRVGTRQCGDCPRPIRLEVDVGTNTRPNVLLTSKDVAAEADDLDGDM